jgi:hypothetical protein
VTKSMHYCHFKWTHCLVKYETSISKMCSMRSCGMNTSQMTDFVVNVNIDENCLSVEHVGFFWLKNIQ